MVTDVLSSTCFFMKKFISLFSLLILSASSYTITEAAFNDVPTTDPDIAAYNFVQTQGIMTGSEDGKFHPSLGLTRCELLKVALVASHTTLTTDTSSTFPDISATNWCNQYAKTAKAKSIISGYPDGTFQPNRKVTQIEALKILLNSAQVELPIVSQQKYTDVLINTWWAPYIQYSQDTILSSNPIYLRHGASFGINQEMKRAEAAYILWRLFSNDSTMVEPTGISMGLGTEGSYWLVNIDSGTKTNFLPGGYTVLSPESYQPFPTYLILQKSNELYSYQVSTKENRKINGLRLASNQTAYVEPSISEKGQFLILISSADPNHEPGMGEMPPLDRTAYRYYAESNSLSNQIIPVEKIQSSCRVYDSVKNQLYTWICQEGIGSTTPLATVNIASGTEQTVIARSDPEAPEYNQVRYNNHQFFISDVSTVNESKLKVVTTNFSQPTIETYTTLKSVPGLEQKVTDTINNPYGIAQDSSTTTFVVGKSQTIVLLRYNAQKEIIDYKEIDEPEIYPNYLFTYEGKLYYQGKDGTRVVNLRTWAIEKTIPGVMHGEITLF